MKIAVIFVFLALTLSLPAAAEERVVNNSAAPEEYAGYVLYNAVNSKGDNIVVRNPVKYKIRPASTQDNDANYEYRNYRIEMERKRNDEAERKYLDNENKKINSAANYPLYFN